MGAHLAPEQRDALRGAITAFLQEDPKGTPYGFFKTLEERLDFRVSEPTVYRYFRDVVESGGVPADYGRKRGLADLVEELPSFEKVSGKVKPPRLPVPPREKPESTVEPLRPVEVKPKMKVDKVVGTRELVLSQVERASEYNRGFADCYLAIAAAGLVLPTLVRKPGENGLQVLALVAP
jgi:hypothetical protein